MTYAFGFSIQDYAILQAKKAGTLAITDSVGRFGSFVYIEDETGCIEAFDTREEAQAAIDSALKKKIPNCGW